MNKPTGKGLVPKLRFPEFRGEWIKTTLGDVADYANGKAHEQDIDEKGRFIVVNSKFISTEGQVVKYSNASNLLACTNDILMVLSDVPNGRAISKCFYVESDDTYTVNQRICKLTSRKSISKFLFSLLDRNPYFLSFDDGVKQTNLKNDDVLNCPLVIPKDNNEQQKIADCLSSLDDLVSAHNQKLDALKAHKKGLMQQLFPAEGETVPKLRFPEFINMEPWEAKYLLNTCNLQAGKFVKAAEIKEQLGNSLYPCYGGNGLRGFTTTFTHEGEYSLIGRQGALCGNITFVCKKFHATEHAVVVTPKDNVNKYWLYYELVRLDLNRFATGQAQPGLSVDNLLKVKTTAPKTESEQQKIADCLSSIDELITAQSKKIETLKLHKKGLMQQLFPTVDGIFMSVKDKAIQNIKAKVGA